MKDIINNSADMDSLQDIVNLIRTDIDNILDFLAENIPNFSGIIVILKVFFIALFAYLLIGFSTLFIRRVKRKKLLNALANTALELTPEEFRTLRSDAFVGKEKKHYPLAQDFSGIYILFNKTRKMHYVGQSIKVMNRVNDHFQGRGNGDVYADYIYNDEFTIKIIALENSGYNSLNTLERHMISHYKAFSKGYNKTRGNRG